MRSHLRASLASKAAQGSQLGRREACAECATDARTSEPRHHFRSGCKQQLRPAANEQSSSPPRAPGRRHGFPNVPVLAAPGRSRERARPRRHVQGRLS
ncbi:hypothetical protein MTO96_011901 [Rhipicephalus appendiculatus]